MPSLYTYTLFVFFLCCHVASVSTAQVQEDSTAAVVFPPDELYEMVLKYHPVASQAGLVLDDARAELLMARGGFDPKFKGNYDQKYFKGDEYYTHLKPQLTIPTLPGIDIMAGFEQNTGINLNPENITAKGEGLYFAGVAVPIGRGMFIDERRATLRKAQIFQEIAEAEQRKMINKLLFQVAKDYWQWYYYYHQVQFLNEGMQLARFRYNAVKQEVAVGNLAPIDSTEALINFQTREIDLQQAQNALVNARLVLSNHIWGPEGEPLELEENLVPVDFGEWLSTAQNDIDGLESLLNYAAANHPELLKLAGKLDQLVYDRRLARENLKPVVDVKYNLLTETVGDESINGALLSENYKFGVKAEMPLLLRKERGKFQSVRIKTDQTNLELINTRRALFNEIEAIYNEYVTLRMNLDIQERMVKNYQRMLAGERQMFRVGQSTVFYVNIRESKLIEAQVKLYNMRQKIAKTIAELKNAIGMGL